MDIEQYLYEHRYMATALGIVALHWLLEKEAITPWAGLVGFSSLVTGCVYIMGVRDPLDLGNALSAVGAVALWAVVWRKRPRPAAPDGSHEAL